MLKNVIVLVLLIVLFGANTNASVQESWKTYSNVKFNYTFKYPSDWVIDDTLSSSSDGGVKVYKGNMYGSGAGGGDGAEVYISHRKNVEGFTLDEWKNLVRRITDVEEGTYVNGIHATKLTGKVYIPSGVLIPVENSTEIRLLIIKNDLRFEVTCGAAGPNFMEYTTTINEILSTFRYV